MGDLGSISGWEIPPGEANGYPLTPGFWPAVHGAAKSQTRLSLSLLLQQCTVSQLKLICKTIKLNKLKEKLFSHIEKQAVHDSDA